MRLAVGSRQLAGSRARAALLCAAVSCALAGGCGGSGSKSPSDESVIRGWSAAVNAGRFDRAADYFAKGAVAVQSEVYRFDTHAAAVAWNRSLPCRADVTDVHKGRGAAEAGFRLREGRRGGCGGGGSARVRFRIRDGKILEWRQLPDAPGFPGGSGQVA